MNMRSASLSSAPIGLLSQTIVEPDSYEPAVSGEKENRPLTHRYGNALSQPIKAIVRVTDAVFNCTLTFIARSIEETSTLSVIGRKLDRHILPMIQQVRELPVNHFKRFSTAIRALVGAIDCAQAAADFEWLSSGRFIKESLPSIYGKFCLTLSDVSYALLWLNDIGLANLSKASAALGEMRLFSFAPIVVSRVDWLQNQPYLQQAAASLGELRVFSFFEKINLTLFADTTLAISCLFFMRKVFDELHHATKFNQKERIFIALTDGLCLTSELAINAVRIAGCAGVLGLGIMSCVSVSLAITSLGWRSVYAARVTTTNPLQKI